MIFFALVKNVQSALSPISTEAGGEGHWYKGEVGFGHRRLAIIDLSKEANQPMISADRRYILTYNGEVYNFQELRNELVEKGYNFTSNSDSEVVLYSLIEWKEKALLKFNGMFAFSFWDEDLKILLLGRDRYGIKPLYYSNRPNSFTFASEQKSILIQPDFNKSINKKALLEYFTFQNIFTDQTLVDDISLLPAGYFGKIDLKKRIVFNLL